jgi:hypothetical protein
MTDEAKPDPVRNWGQPESWMLRLMNDGHKVAEVACRGAAPAIGARICMAESQYDIVGYPDAPCRVRRTTAIVTAQEARIEDFSCYLLVIARMESRHTFPRRDDEG